MKKLYVYCVLSCISKMDESPDWEWIGKLNLSAYYIPCEDQPEFAGGAKVPIRAIAGKGGSYLRNTGLYGDDVQEAQKANENFLYSRESVCMQGTGRLSDGRYIKCTTVSVNWDGVQPRNQRGGIGFYWKVTQSLTNLRAFKTVAKWQRSTLVPLGSRIYIPELVNYLAHWDSNFTNGILEVTDKGGGLYCEETDTETLDLFTGEGSRGCSAAIDLLDCSTQYPHSGWWDKPKNKKYCRARPPFGQCVDVYKWKH
jgi:hypothetical protein